jgi:hypothetical protein
MNKYPSRWNNRSHCWKCHNIEASNFVFAPLLTTGGGCCQMKCHLSAVPVRTVLCLKHAAVLQQKSFLLLSCPLLPDCRAHFWWYCSTGTSNYSTKTGLWRISKIWCCAGTHHLAYGACLTSAACTYAHSVRTGTVYIRTYVRMYVNCYVDIPTCQVYVSMYVTVLAVSVVPMGVGWRYTLIFVLSPVPKQLILRPPRTTYFGGFSY